MDVYVIYYSTRDILLICANVENVENVNAIIFIFWLHNLCMCFGGNQRVDYRMIKRELVQASLIPTSAEPVFDVNLHPTIQECFFLSCFDLIVNRT